MPVLSRFYGIIIKMYFLPKEHNPPHVHVIYQDDTFSISIKDLVIIDGEEHPATRALSMVKEWIILHRDELLKMWETQDLHSIEPLKQEMLISIIRKVNYVSQSQKRFSFRRLQTPRSVYFRCYQDL